MAGKYPAEAERLADAIQDYIFFCDRVYTALRIAKQKLPMAEMPAESSGGKTWQEERLWLRDSLGSFWDAHAEAGAALDALSPNTLSQLHAIGGDHWRQRLRHALNESSSWLWSSKPDERRGFSADESPLIGMLYWSEPPDIQQHRRTILEFQRHLLAVEGEFTPPESVVTGGELPSGYQSEESSLTLPTNVDQRELWYLLNKPRAAGVKDTQIAREFSSREGERLLRNLKKAASIGTISKWKPTIR